MSVIVHGRVEVQSDKVGDIGAAAIAFQQQCQAEPGCEAYVLSWDVAQPNLLHLLEDWVDEAASDHHVGQEHVAIWTKAISAAALGAPTFTRHVL